MPKSPLIDAFDHYIWASLRLLDTCVQLQPEQLATTVTGTYGSILDTTRHLIGADAAYLAVISGGRHSQIEEEGMDLPELRDAMERIGTGWTSVLAEELDPDRVIVRHRDDGSSFHASLGIRLAQVLHHGTDHRSQICTTLTALGIEPPEIDVWAFAEANGRAKEVLPQA